MFGDFRRLLNSTGFITLVKSLSKSCLVISRCERVSRKNNSAISKIMTSKQRESADDTVYSEVHVALVSFEFCPG